MMLRKRLILLLSALTLVAGAGCTKNTGLDKSSVILTISTGDIVTKTGETTGDAIAFDNNVPDLFIAIANSLNEIVAIYPGANSELMENASSTQLSVKFTNFQNNGDFTVFAVANTAGLWGMNSTLNSFTVGGSSVALNSLVFNALAGDANPTLGNGVPMPLSAKGTLSVNEGLNGHANIELLRCVAKVAFKFKNETGQSLTLTNCSVTIHDMNPTQGYLFPQETDATGTARNLYLIQSTTFANDGAITDFYGDLLVFPSVAPAQTVGSRYYCDIAFTVNDEAKSFTNLAIHDKHSQDILALGRNQYLKIETRINRGLDVSFSFEVLDWNQKTEEIIFH